MINIENIRNTKKAFDCFGLFCSLVVDTSLFKLSKLEKRKLKEAFDSLNEETILVQSNIEYLQMVVDSFDYETARKNKIKDKHRKLNAKRNKQKQSAPRKNSGIQVIPSGATSNWKPQESSEVRDKSYYTNLRKSNGDSRSQNDIRDLPKLGLGLESVVSIPRIKSDEVVIDQHTQTKGNAPTKHHLYTAGWSSKGHFVDIDEETS
ncbi:hypothetical protein ACPV3U_21540 [Vibrio rotiferianus]|uniref:hypothetical protein n=1 Tax=Vibrio rotiferianus TaxID=190895 RepID=UPI00406A36F9